MLNYRSNENGKQQTFKTNDNMQLKGEESFGELPKTFHKTITKHMA
jgi:hypothetical protein